MWEKVLIARNRNRAPQIMFAKFNNKDITIKIKRQKEGEQFLIYTNSLPINKRNQKHGEKNEKKK